MSIDTIQLTAGLCQELFSKSLVANEESEQTSERKVYENKSPEIQKIKKLGENQQNILFIVNNNENAFLGDEEMKLLSDLLLACKISMMDISLVNYHQNPKINYDQIKSELDPKKILVFGVSAEELNLPSTTSFFEIKKFENVSFIICPNLSEFLKNKTLKRQLWISLQQLFQL
jgi:hypothetical protein